MDRKSGATVYRLIVQSDQYHIAPDSRLLRAARQLGLAGISAITPVQLYFVESPNDLAAIERLTNTLLADRVIEEAKVQIEGQAVAVDGHYVEVTLLPGVTDPAAENLRRAAERLGITVTRAATGQRYLVELHDDAADQLEPLATRVLANPVVQQVAIDRPAEAPFIVPHAADGTVESIPLRAADGDALRAISADRRLSMNLDEMRAIQNYYRAADREPTDVELEMLAQTWSEHCVHKTFKATIDYTGPDGEREQIDGLLNTYIRAATEKINKKWVYSAFEDDAGIIRFDDRFDVAFKVETHNHPSALEPFGGANTGVGGVIRDVLAVSARPIANTDVLCFGMPDMPHEALPDGVLHPARVADGVVHGIEDYGNKMGIPTVNGTIVYDPGYTANPLVYCGCVGLLPHGVHRNEVQPGDRIVALGGRVGRDGLRGATFSSMQMDESTGEIAGTAVQIGHPIMEKQVLEVVLRCRDEQLYSAITDCGAGGFSSSIGELGEKVGATVELSHVALKYPGLQPWEIWLSEAQERMVLAVPAVHLARVQALAASQDVEATVLGTFEPTGRMKVTYEGRTVCDLTMEFLHDGLPPRHMTAAWSVPQPRSTPAQTLLPAAEALLALLAHPTIRSKEDVVRRYDHEVQTGTAVKPFVGVHNHGPSDASVIVPLDAVRAKPADEATRGVAIANGICPAIGARDPYAMAWAAVDEALRNLVAVGANPDEVAILDNFCWGNPALPDRLGALVRCAQGCHDAAVAMRAPFISGKDSLNNEYVTADGSRRAIPGTLLISAVGLVPDVERTVTMPFKRAGNRLYIVGDTRAEMGGSHYAQLHDEDGGTPPQPVSEGLVRYRSLHRAIRRGHVAACHDLSEGGLAVALAEMALAGGLGATVDLSAMPASIAHDDVLLFSESLGRFLVEVAPEQDEAFRQQLAAEPHAVLGTVAAEPRLTVTGVDGDTVLNLALDAIDAAWRGHLPPADPVVTPTTPPADAAAAYVPAVATHRPRVLILHANGTNRDRDAALACELAGGAPEIVHINALHDGSRRMEDYQMLVVPGGFSYGDDLGAGVLFAADLKHSFHDALQTFIDAGKPVLGICNGFQALVKAGIFTVASRRTSQRRHTLTYNERGHFECRWVWLEPTRSADHCLFTSGLREPIYCPVAHGEGRFILEDASAAKALYHSNRVVLTYTSPGGGVGYPANPNGSVDNIAGIRNGAGNVLGLMPHPENHIFPWQHPQRDRGATGLDGLRLFANGIRHA